MSCDALKTRTTISTTDDCEARRVESCAIVVQCQFDAVDIRDTKVEISIRTNAQCAQVESASEVRALQILVVGTTSGRELLEHEEQDRGDAADVSDGAQMSRHDPTCRL